MGKDITPIAEILDKIEFIRTEYRDCDFFDFINDIKNPKNQHALHSELEYYVPYALRNNQDDSIKYGWQTQKEFINAFKRRTDKILIESKLQIRLQDLAVDTLKGLFILWCKEKKLLPMNAKKDEILEISDKKIINKLVELNQNKKLSKEDILKFYKFNQFLSMDNDIRIKVESLKYSKGISEMSKEETERIEQQAHQIVEAYGITVDDAIDLLSEYDFEDVCEALEAAEAEMEEEEEDNTEEYEETDEDEDEIEEDEDEEEFQDVSIEKYNDLVDEYNEVVEELQAYKISEAYSITVDDAADMLKDYSFDEVCEALDNYEQDLEDTDNEEKSSEEESSDENDLTKEDLIEENAYLKALVKKLEVSDAQKMKQSLESKISELERQLELKNSESEFDEDIENEEEKYKDKYNSLSKTLDKIKNLKIADLDKKICSDKKYQQLIMSLILHNSVASKLLLKHLDITETTRNIIIDARTQISDLQQQMLDLENGAIQINTNKPDGANNKKINEYSYSPKEPDFSMSQYLKTLKDNIELLYEDEALNIDIGKVTDSNFIIVNDERLIEALYMKWYGIPFCRVSAEPGWKSIDDWFGYYDKDGKFVPSKTLISDYYQFVKDTMELPFGVIVFDNFNQIPPEIYIEPFIKNIESNGYYQLANPVLITDNSEYGTIEKLHNLKYIMIKSTNDTAFEIPNSMKKYELGA